MRITLVFANKHRRRAIFKSGHKVGEHFFLEPKKGNKRWSCYRVTRVEGVTEWVEQHPDAERLIKALFGAAQPSVVEEGELV